MSIDFTRYSKYKKRIEKKIVNTLTIDGSFIIKADSLYYFYDPSEKIYEVTSDEFI